MNWIYPHLVLNSHLMFDPLFLVIKYYYFDD